MVTTEQIKALRAQTGISITDCKKALEEALGDEVKALEILKVKGDAAIAKKSDRDLGAGLVVSYIHGLTIGSLVDVRCETDFVAKNPEFKTMAEDVAMQVAAMMPADIEELNTQTFIKDPSFTIGDLIKNAVQKFGERVEIVRFVRFDIAE